MFANVLGSVPLRRYPAGVRKPFVQRLGSGKPAPRRGPAAFSLGEGRHGRLSDSFGRL